MENRKIAMAVGAILVVAVVAAVAVVITRDNYYGSSGSTEDSTDISTSSKAIKDLCQPTDFKERCEHTILRVAGNTTDTKELVKAAFNVTMQNLHYVFTYSKTLSDASQDAPTAAALRDCQEVLDYALDDLQHSLDKVVSMEEIYFDRLVDDLLVWITSVRTYEETCLDGFDNRTKFGEQMKNAMNSSIELTTNIMAIVDEFGTEMDSFEMPSSGRRLLNTAEGLPSWFSLEQRRLLQQTPAQMKPDVVVAQDGSGRFRTINEALLEIPKNNPKPFIIYIKEGVYAEKVRLTKYMTNVVMIGDGPTKTRITGSLNFVDGVSTYKTCTLDVLGNNFIGKDFGVENTAGPGKHQAVAIKVQGDYSVFYNCRFDGYQDTLYAHSKRQFYRDCTISGTIDFIFGNAPVIFQNCLILVRKPMDNQQNIVTAQGRTHRREFSGIILHNCTIKADPEFEQDKGRLRSYLGRPWKEFSRTVYIQTYIDGFIHSDGWLPWTGDYGLSTCFYTEIDNWGPGSDMSRRVTWKGVKKLDYEHGQKFTVNRFFGGATWLPATGVPFTPGLLPQGSRH